jgi:hypothetical protein
MASRRFTVDLAKKKKFLDFILQMPKLRVETKSHGTDVPSSRAYEYAQKKVTWKDPLFPRRKPSSSSSPRTAK